MYLVCSDWSIRSLKEKEEEEENCHLLITAVVPTGAVIKTTRQVCLLLYTLFLGGGDLILVHINVWYFFRHKN